MQIIHLDESDDIVSLCDRLTWAEARRVLLVLPNGVAGLLNGLDLVRLRRHADQLRLEVGLVTPHKDQRRQAQGLGIPSFATEQAGCPVGRDHVGRDHARRGWWRGRRRREQIGLPFGGRRGGVDGRQRPLLPAALLSPSWPVRSAATTRQWLLRYLAIFLFFIALALLTSAFLYALPRATITLQPEVQPLPSQVQLVADPQVGAANPAAATIPGRVLLVTESWRAETATTGSLTVAGRPARGQVVFTNRTAEPVAMVAGTRVLTEAGMGFLTAVDLTLAGATGSTAEVNVVAERPGPEGNLAAGQLIRLDGPLAEQVSVQNPEPLTGGAIEQVTVVAAADRQRLQGQVRQFLQTLALSTMTAQLTEREFLARESLRLVMAPAERYSHEVGEQTNRLRLEMTAAFQATAVDTTPAAGIVLAHLVGRTPVGYELVPESLTFAPGAVLAADDQGRVTFVLAAEALITPRLDLPPLLAQVAGQEPAVAQAYLYAQLPLQTPPEVRIWPLWFQRLPYQPQHIRVDRQPRPEQD